MRLDELKLRSVATVAKVESKFPDDPIAQRLRDIGFVQGEPVRVLSTGPFGADPLLIQVGFTRFALRKSEAARVLLN
jgi:ferrous iron transport protein A